MIRTTCSRFLVLILALGLFVGLARPTAAEDDFVPPKGAARGPGGNGPWSNRLMTARSKDGLAWERTGQVVTDQGDVPDLVVLPGGRVHLYYTGWSVGKSQNRTVLAISEDGGKRWSFRRVRLEGFDEMASPVDPDVTLPAPGTFRLYVTSDPHDGGGPRTWWADSQDGIRFVKGGTAFYSRGRHVLDPSVARIGDRWHLFAGGETEPPGANWHAVSEDGKTFQRAREVVLGTAPAGSPRHAMANGVPVPGGCRFYTFSHGRTAQIYSFFTPDGARWTMDPGVRLALDPQSERESGYVKDPAVARLADGSWLMVYVTRIPGASR